MNRKLWLLLGWLLLAASAAVQAQFTCTTNADGISITITGYTGSGDDVTIPSTFNSLAVTDIGTNAFSDSDLTNVTIPNSVTSIEDYAFYGCTNLTYVTIPNSITNLGFRAFGGSGLTSVTIPGSVSSIWGQTFASCTSLTNVTIGDGVTNIGAFAFFECFYLETVTIPASVTLIGPRAFGYCTFLSSVYFLGNAPFIVPINRSYDNFSFYYDDYVTAYYLPGATGWPVNMFGEAGTMDDPYWEGISSMLWNPVIQAGDGSFGVRNGQFGFNVVGTANIPILVEASTSLATPVWTPLATMTLTNGSVYFSEPTNSVCRFYRIRSP